MRKIIGLFILLMTHASFATPVTTPSMSLEQAQSAALPNNTKQLETLSTTMNNAWRAQQNAPQILASKKDTIKVYTGEDIGRLRENSQFV